MYLYFMRPATTLLISLLPSPEIDGTGTLPRLAWQTRRGEARRGEILGTTLIDFMPAMPNIPPSTLITLSLRSDDAGEDRVLPLSMYARELQVPDATYDSTLGNATWMIKSVKSDQSHSGTSTLDAKGGRGTLETGITNRFAINGVCCSLAVA